MNTIRSTWLGWGVLIIAGGGSYYFAKRSVTADRNARYAEEQRRRQLSESLEYSSAPPPKPRRKEPREQQQPPQVSDLAGSPSGEASHDPAPTGQPIGGSEAVVGAVQKSKYEPREPYRTKKGDRFS